MLDITFQSLEIKDLKLLHKWLNTEHVVEWYGKKPVSLKEIEDKYLPRIEGLDPTKSYMIIFQDKPIGYIQSYLARDDKELQECVETEGMAGLDMFIGEQRCLGKGLGRKIIEEFLRQVIFQQPDVTSCIVDPLPSNPRMIHVCERVGFVHLMTTKGQEPKYFMVIRRDENDLFRPYPSSKL